MKIVELIKILDDKYCFLNQEEWDHCGVLEQNNSDTNQEITNILISLDISKQLIDKAIKNKANVIITHHPIYVGSLEEQHNINWINDVLELLNANNIIHISLHTCYDTYKHGTSYSIIKHLFTNNKSIIIKRLGNSKYCDYIELEKPIKISNLIKKIKKSKKVKFVKAIRSFYNREVKNIGVVGGSGFSEIYNILESNAKIDCLLTGDVKWHNFTESYELYFPIIDIGHDAEWLGCLEIFNFLKCYISNITFIKPLEIK